MIAFGCAISEPEPYHRYAEPGIASVREPDSRIYPFASVGASSRSYNLLLESAAANDDLEALVLVHSYAQIDDPAFMAKVRAGLADPEVAVLGVAGASEPRSIAWWDARVSRGPVVQRYTELGGGEVPAWGWADAAPAPARVDVVDGFVLVLSPWAVRTVRFDESLVLGYGVAVDYCLQVRAAERRVATIDARVVEHRSLELLDEPGLWAEAHIAVARKWEGRWPGGDPATDGEPAWERRARRAEAEREVARALAYSRRLGFDAQLDALQARIDRLYDTPSWRLTRPLRELNRVRRERSRG